MIKVGIAGPGTIGKATAQGLDTGIPGIRLEAVGLRDQASHATWLGSLRSTPRMVSMDELSLVADVIVECTGATGLEHLGSKVLEMVNILGKSAA